MKSYFFLSRPPLPPLLVVRTLRKYFFAAVLIPTTYLHVHGTVSISGIQFTFHLISSISTVHYGRFDGVTARYEIVQQ